MAWGMTAATPNDWRFTGRGASNAASVPSRDATARRVLADLETHLKERRFLPCERLTIDDIVV